MFAFLCKFALAPRDDKPLQGHRVLKTALLGTCAPHCRLQMLSCYKAESLDAGRVAAFGERVEKALAGWR